MRVTPCSEFHLGHNCIQHFYLGRYIVGYTVRNLVLRRHASRIKIWVDFFFKEKLSTFSCCNGGKYLKALY